VACSAGRVQLESVVAGSEGHWELPAAHGIGKTCPVLSRRRLGNENIHVPPDAVS
jgi:hypothetical protein